MSDNRDSNNNPTGYTAAGEIQDLSSGVAVSGTASVAVNSATGTATLGGNVQLSVPLGGSENLSNWQPSLEYKYDPFTDKDELGLKFEKDNKELKIVVVEPTSSEPKLEVSYNIGF